ELRADIPSGHDVAQQFDAHSAGYLCPMRGKGFGRDRAGARAPERVDDREARLLPVDESRSIAYSDKRSIPVPAVQPLDEGLVEPYTEKTTGRPVAQVRIFIRCAAESAFQHCIHFLF